MFVGCSEIGMIVIVKHINTGIIRVFNFPERTCSVFQCLRGQKKLLDCGLLMGIRTQADTMHVLVT